MYIEYRSNSRENWHYVYKGSELQAGALKRYWEAYHAEQAARAEMVAMLSNMKIPSSHPTNEQLKKEIELQGTNREKCSVWVIQTEREPDREFSLSMGDVIFFHLVTEPQLV